MPPVIITAGPDADASFHLINYPPEAGFATVGCSTKAGTIRVTSAAGGSSRDAEVRPLSPIYNLNNPAAGLNLTVPLGANGDKPETVGITFVNDSPAVGEVTVVVGVSFLPEQNQNQLAFKRSLAAGASTFFHVVFNRVG